MPMRGVAVLLAYVVGLSAVIGIGVIGLMALQAPITPTPPAASVAAVSHKERLAKPVKQTTTTRAQPSQKRKVAHVTRKPKEDASSLSSGFKAYGYAQEPRHFYQYPPDFFAR
jgi:hypothetical protein